MTLYHEIIRRFPRNGMVYSFAYGSGVKQQLGYDSASLQKNNIIDFIFCVDSAQSWHEQNIEEHPSHYSSIRMLGSKFIGSYQNTLAAGVYYNTLVPLKDLGVTIKYGVVSKDVLLGDLEKWNHLYLAGRLHKPVFDVVPPADSDVQLCTALEKNLFSAFAVALLLLPDKFSDFELYHTICSLSYKGDFRMIFGENKNKVRNIVDGQLQEFFDLYRPVMRQLSRYVAMAKSNDGNRASIMFEQETSLAAIEFCLRNLPENLQQQIVVNAACKGTYGQIVEQISSGSNMPDIVQTSVNDIVRRSSVTQTLKNIITAGLLKSFAYGYRKALKTFTK